MADISIREAHARIWEQDVSSEIDSVRTLLTKVRTAISLPAGEDDTILQGIESTGRKMEDSWNRMFDRFKRVSSKMEEIISMLSKQAAELSQEAQSIHVR